MEERRLKNLMSHLSLCSNCPLENSAVFNEINKAENMPRTENSGVANLDITQGNPQQLLEEQNASRFISKSRSSSKISERRQSSFVEEQFMRGAQSGIIKPSSQGADALLKAVPQCRHSSFLSASLKGITRNLPPKDRPSHIFLPLSEAASHRCECLLRSKTLSQKVEGNCPCLQINDRGLNLRTSAQGYSVDNSHRTVSHSSQVQNNSATQFEHVCSSSDSKIDELEGQCKSCNSRKVLFDAFQGSEAHHRLCIVDDREALKAQTLKVSDSEVYNFDKDVAPEQQKNGKTPHVQQSSLEHILMTCRNMHVPDSQPVNVGMGTSVCTTLSRNNAMTGQRRHIVEDCIFCRIIQGQSPAFKLYEDEMCVCILDVHPLTHGHSLLIPKAHFPSLELTPPEVAAAMCATVPFISMAIMQATNCDSFNLLVNSGKAAGQVVLHTHFHIIPRRSGDNLWRSEDDSRRALPVGNETAVLVQQIRHNLSNKLL